MICVPNNYMISKVDLPNYMFSVHPKRGSCKLSHHPPKRASASSRENQCNSQGRNTTDPDLELNKYMGPGGRGHANRLWLQIWVPNKSNDESYSVLVCSFWGGPVIVNLYHVNLNITIYIYRMNYTNTCIICTCTC